MPLTQFYPTTPHLSFSTGTSDDTFMSAAESFDVLRRCTLIQPKRDGINLGAHLENGEVRFVLKGRSPTAMELEHLAGLSDQIRPKLQHLARTLPPGSQIFGELAPGVPPSLSSWEIFDVRDPETTRFLTQAEFVSSFAASGLSVVPVIHRGPVRRKADLDVLLGQGQTRLEGLVLRVETEIRTERFKYVRSDFQKSLWALA